MVSRLVKLSRSNSFFLFGPRGVGKTSLLKAKYPPNKDVYYIDLLLPKTEDRYRLSPEALRAEVLESEPEWVIIDEVQKLPRLLDVVHSLIEETRQKFILTGSSARKLKRGAANLLAGRAFTYHLHPFTSVELGSNFDLGMALEWGLLPQVVSFQEADDKKEFLLSYSLSYLKEEIQAEQVVRRVDPFRFFLQIAAQMNGKPINYSKIAKDVGVDTTTVQNYFSILEDTLIGFYLTSYHKSIRKRQRGAPKFYFFDPGVVRALNDTLDVPMRPQTYMFGEAFEHFLILEIRKLADYKRKSWSYSYLQTKDDVEIDLIIEEKGKRTVCIEIKSGISICESDIKQFIKLTSAMKNVEALCLSNDSVAKRFGDVRCLHWRDGLRTLGLI